MIPARFAPALFGFIMSGMMSCMVTGIATLKAVGFGPSTLANWLTSWAFSWPIAFTVILIASPAVRRLVQRLVRPDA
ncbi:MAG: DUF2798 domain-containing protein [Ruegeria sp.]